MTLEELRENWKKYTFIHNDGESAPLRGMYRRCVGECEGGLLFHLKIKELDGELIGELTNVDENDNYYTKITVNGVLIGRWIHIGRLVKSRAFRRRRDT